MPGTTVPQERFKLAMLGIAGGALFGAVLAPIVAWLFLRRAGAVVRPRSTILFGLAGFVAAGARLWWVARASVSNDTLRAGAARSSAWR